MVLADAWNLCGSNSWVKHRSVNANRNCKETQLGQSCSFAMCASQSSSGSYQNSKRVWIWTQSKEVMTASVERGWNTFVFSSKHRQLANEWSCKFLRTLLLFFFCISRLQSAYSFVLCSFVLYASWIDTSKRKDGYFVTYFWNNGG